jgi:hypothetical protein
MNLKNKKWLPNIFHFVNEEFCCIVVGLWVLKAYDFSMLGILMGSNKMAFT